MTKAKMATIEKFGQKINLINPEKDISLENLCKKFGERTIKINSLDFSIFEIEALNGIENHINIEEIKNAEWKEIEIN